MFDSLFNLHFVVEHIYEILHLLALRFRVKLAISFYTVVCYHCNAYPRAERYKKHERYSFTKMKHDYRGSVTQLTAV